MQVGYSGPRSAQRTKTADRQGCCIGGVARIPAWWAKKCCKVAAATACAPVPLEPPDTMLVTTIPGLSRGAAAVIQW